MNIYTFVWWDRINPRFKVTFRKTLQWIILGTYGRQHRIDNGGFPLLLKLTEVYFCFETFYSLHLSRWAAFWIR